jgi:Leucine-rich repeat (LRR) protein
MANYPYLRKISFKANQLTDISSLAWINYLTHLMLSRNEITSIATFNIKDSL